MYRSERRRSAALYLGAGIAVAVSLALIAFFVHALVLRNSYRAMCLEINDAILTAPADRCTIARGGDEYPIDRAGLDFFDRFLLEDGTAPFRRGAEPAAERTITLDLNGKQLLLTGTEQDTAVNLRWITPEGEQSYTVRTGGVSFSQLSAYYTRLSHRAGA